MSELQPKWEETIAGKQCRCNYCYIQFKTREQFAAHWDTCPVRQKCGYIKPEPKPQAPLERQCERVAKMLGLPPDTPVDEVLEASLQWIEQTQGK